MMEMEVAPNNAHLIQNIKLNGENVSAQMAMLMIKMEDAENGVQQHILNGILQVELVFV